MPRPESLLPEFIRNCEASFDASAEIPEGMKSGTLRAFMLELWIAGIVLKEALVQSGCNETLADQILFSHGQLSVGRDPWEVGDYIYEHYKAGFYPTPGEDLLVASFSGRRLPMSPVPQKDDT